ncbi:MAG TPA: UbiA family prenyltransferase [Desulfobacterales bacterium]|nr:UbiA family prenyltransferase [Desulfobacterales bacterium]
MNILNGIPHLKHFWALSRTPHGLLDMCTPAFAALVWIGGFPPVDIVLIGLLTTFAGYTAVYALNDLVDYRVDREKAAQGGLGRVSHDLDGVIARHPMATGLVSFKEGMAWAGFWCVIALIGAYLLNPVCVAIFLGGCILESLYCRLWRVSPFRALVSGAVKTSGALAAVFAVDPSPSAFFLAALFLMLFFWEIGGQNIPNDLTDIEEDRRLGARTIPVQFGVGRAGGIAALSIAAAVVSTAAVFLLSPLPHAPLAALAALAAGCSLLVQPGLVMVKRNDQPSAMALFNRASYYPAALLGVVLIGLVI